MAAHTARSHPGGRLPGLFGWVMVDWAAQPLYTLILTFLFAPYFANVVVGDAVRGQAVWGYAAAAAGFIVALGSPVLGAIADASGRRKAYVFVCSLGIVAGLCGLWLAKPGVASPILAVLAFFVLAFVAAEFAAVFTNAMMPTLVARHELGRLSGIGWGTGYAGGLVSLGLAGGLLIADPATGRTLLGGQLPFPLDFAAHQGERLLGPFCAAWYVLFILPFFLLTPDTAPALRPTAPLREGLRKLAQTLRSARRYGGILRFLLARMLYVDGLGAIFAFGGIYAASIFGWSSFELGLFGIILTVTGAVGAAVGGLLDDRLGARVVIVGSLIGLMTGCLGIVSIGDGRALFVIAAPMGGGPVFASFAEQLYLVFAILIGIVAGPLQAASRSLLARLAPREMMGEFFGLFAFSGKITAFAAPLLVGAVTAASGSQRVGIATILLFLVAGLVLMLGVREKS